MCAYLKGFVYFCPTLYTRNGEQEEKETLVAEHQVQVQTDDSQ